MTDQPTELYLELLKGVITRQIAPDRFRLIPESVLRRNSRLGAFAYLKLNALLSRFGLAICRVWFDPAARCEGSDWPGEAETMVGSKRLDNVHECVRSVIQQGVPGDFIETGVWRGGVTIFMRAALAAYGDPSRLVWVADSFQGLPKHDPRFPHVDVKVFGSDSDRFNDVLGVSLEDVKRNFERYGMLDDRVRFLPGWFKDTLHVAPIERLSVLRLDGDLYASTMDALTALYPRLSVGGYLIVDDYGGWEGCAKAVDEYRARNGITEPIQTVDSSGVFWRREL